MDPIYEAYSKETQPIEEAKIVFDSPDEQSTMDAAMDASGYLEENLDKILKQQRAMVKKVEASLKAAGHKSKEVRDMLEDGYSQDKDGLDIDQVWPK